MSRNFKMHLTCIFSHKKRTAFMQAMGLFEKKKVLFQEEIFVVDGKTADDFENMDAAIARLLDSAQAGFIDNWLIFMHVSHVVWEDGEVYRNTKIPPFFEKEINCLSTGEKWVLFRDAVQFIVNPYFAVETDHYNCVTAIKPKANLSS